MVRPYKSSREHERRCRSGPPSAPHQTALEKIWFWAVVGAGRAGRYPTARAGRWPPGMYAITCTRKLSRSGTRMCHPGGGLTADLGTILLRAPPQRNPHINSVRATVPCVPSVQPSVVVLTTADPPISKLEPQHPPPLPPKHHRPRKQVCIPPFAFLFHRVAWVTKPHPSPPHRPPRWLLPTTTLCSAETDPNSPRCPCPSPLPANAE